MLYIQYSTNDRAAKVVENPRSKNRLGHRRTVARGTRYTA